MKISENIKFYRKKARLTQKELANKTGLSIGTIQGYEQGKYTPKIENIEKIAQVLGVHIVDIKEDITFDEMENTKEAIASDKYLASWNSILTFLADIYGSVEVINVDKGYSCGFFYLVGENDDKFILHAEDIDALCDATRAAIPYLVNRLKDERPLEDVRSEYEDVPSGYEEI